MNRCSRLIIFAVGLAIIVSTNFNTRGHNFLNIVMQNLYYILPLLYVIKAALIH